MKKEKILENIIILSAASLAGYFIFKKNWLLPVSFFLLVLGIIGGKPAYWISLAWDGFAGFIGKINSKIILSLIFFVFLTPIAFLFRLFNKEAAGNFHEKKRITQLKESSSAFSKGSFEKPW